MQLFVVAVSSQEEKSKSHCKRKLRIFFGGAENERLKLEIDKRNIDNLLAPPTGKCDRKENFVIAISFVLPIGGPGTVRLVCSRVYIVKNDT